VRHWDVVQVTAPWLHCSSHASHSAGLQKAYYQLAVVSPAASSALANPAVSPSALARNASLMACMQPAQLSSACWSDRIAEKRQSQQKSQHQPAAARELRLRLRPQHQQVKGCIHELLNSR